MYPHSVDGSPELLACDYSITFKRVDKETSVPTTIVEPICDKECTGAVILSDLFKLNIDDDTARAFQDILEDNSKLKMENLSRRNMRPFIVIMVTVPYSQVKRR